MEIPDTTQVALGKAIEAVSRRHDVLASNIANVNTPGYRRLDLSFQDALSAALERGRPAVESLHFAPHVEATGPVRADGNTVDIDRESAELATNALHYQALVDVKKARGAIVKMAAGIE